MLLLAWTLVPTARAGHRGSWRWEQADKPVKVLLLSSSLGRWRFGSFGQFLETACSGIDVHYETRHAVNTRWMIGRFKDSLLRNPNIDLANEGAERWLLYQGGLNSVSTPATTARDMVRLFTLAHEHGLRVVAISVTPWGEHSDSRFDGFDGLVRHDKTRHLAALLTGKLGRREALGRFTDSTGEGGDTWRPAERPDVAVDVLDSVLRHRDGPLRPRGPLVREWRRRPVIRRRYPDMERAVARARRVPQWFLNPEYAYDHVHIKHHGHRKIAEMLCPKLPESWRCDCASIDRMGWVTGEGVILRER